MAVPEIKSEARPRCMLCGSGGTFIYRNQRDRLFGAPGTWDLKQCSNSACQLIWLDPMPLEEEIAKAYLSYHTHQPARLTPEGKLGLLRQSYRFLKRAYLADRFRYNIGVKRALATSIGKLLYLFPPRRQRLDVEMRFLHWVPQGRLLDVGCGSGLWLLLIRQMGWDVEGIDFDQQCVKVARQQGLSVHLGSLEEQQFSSESFDAVTLSHVIEHVPHPVRTLNECLRILKPGGQLVLYTPNTSSVGHRLFKQDWRGLEPPRHLHLFGPTSMRALLHKAGFTRARVRAFNSLHIWKQTFGLWFESFSVPDGFGAKAIKAAGPCLLASLEECWITASRQAGEWLCVTARKN